MDNSWESFQAETYKRPARRLLREFFSNYKAYTALDLGCGCGNEAVYMVRHGLFVYAVDIELNKDFMLERLTKKQQLNIAFIKDDFLKIDYPKVDLVTAFYSISFCSKENFKIIWKKIDKCLNDEGYFVGQLFGEEDDFNNVDWISTFSLSEIKEIFKDYNILKIEEEKYVKDNDDKKWHLYDIIAQKKKRDDIDGKRL